MRPLHRHDWRDIESAYDREWQSCRCGWMRNRYHGHWEYYYTGMPLIVRKRRYWAWLALPATAGLLYTLILR